MAWTTPRTWTDGELVDAAIMNPHIRDNFNAMGPHLVVRKTADETVTSSAALQADNDLLFPVAANEIWHFQMFLRVTADPAGDITVRFTFPTAGNLAVQLLGGTNGSTPSFLQLGATTSPTTGSSIAVSSATISDLITCDGVYVGGANAGNVALEWAQTVSNGTPTTVKANSTLWAVKLA